MCLVNANVDRRISSCYEFIVNTVDWNKGQWMRLTCCKMSFVRASERVFEQLIDNIIIIYRCNVGNSVHILFELVLVQSQNVICTMNGCVSILLGAHMPRTRSILHIPLYSCECKRVTSHKTNKLLHILSWVYFDFIVCEFRECVHNALYSCVLVSHTMKRSRLGEKFWFRFSSMFLDSQ